MPDFKNKSRLELMDIQIGVTIVLCMVLCHIANNLGLGIEALAVTTGALMCVQDSTKSAYTTSLTRVLGVFFGGLFGVAVVLLDNIIEIPFVFYIICGVSVIANLLVCKAFHMIYVQSRVSCLTQILVVLVSDGVDRLDYAVARFVGSLVGALIALVVTMTFAAVVKRIKKD